MIRNLTLALALGLSALPAQAEKLANQLFGAHAAPSQQAPMPVGSYARGCAAGLAELPETGPTWQAMRLSRHRNFGHPVLVQFLQDLSAEATRIGWRGLYIGDMSQPRGGPMTSGHASHQIGLDADIWMLPPKRLDLSRKDRENISSISVRSEDQRGVSGNWSARHAALLKAAAMDPRVDRIFVTPPAKIELCKTAKKRDRAWLQKIRPYWGHDTHFHVRLKCPAGADYCQTQTPGVAEISNGGDGCDASLTWWVTDALKPQKQQPEEPDAPKKKHPRQFTLADLPQQCAAVLSAP